MDYKESKNLNITFKNDEAAQEVIVTFGGIFQKLRKYFVLWFAVAAFAGVLMLVSGIISKNSPKTPVSGLVSFTYKGVEKGKAPDGSGPVRFVLGVPPDGEKTAPFMAYGCRKGNTTY